MGILYLGQETEEMTKVIEDGTFQYYSTLHCTYYAEFFQKNPPSCLRIDAMCMICVLQSLLHSSCNRLLYYQSEAYEHLKIHIM